MNSVYLTREDLETLKQLFAQFPDHHTVEVTSDSSSGIGSIVEAVFHNVKIFGKEANIKFTIADEKDW